MIRAFILDGDGVLFDSEEISLIAFRLTLERYGIHRRPDELTRYVGIGNKGIARIIYEETGKQIDEEEFNFRKDEDYIALSRSRNGPALMPGAMELLDWLDDHKIPYALASSGSTDKITYNLTTTGLRDRFTVIVSGNDVRNSKPHPDIFELAAKRLDIAPIDCLVVEDSINGIKAGIVAGCTVAGIEGTFTRNDLLQHTRFVYRSPEALLRDLKESDWQETFRRV